MKHLEFDVDYSRWAEIPVTFPHGRWADAASWAADFSDAYASGYEDPESARTALLAYASALSFDATLGLYTRFWYLGDASAPPLIANVFAAPASELPDLGLSEIAGAYDADALRPPTVDSLPSELFGETVRVLSTARGEDGRILIGLRHVGRVDDIVVIVDARTFDPTVATLATEDFTTVLDSLRISEVPEPV